MILRRLASIVVLSLVASAAVAAPHACTTESDGAEGSVTCNGIAVAVNAELNAADVAYLKTSIERGDDSICFCDPAYPGTIGVLLKYSNGLRAQQDRGEGAAIDFDLQYFALDQQGQSISDVRATCVAAIAPLAAAGICKAD